MDWQQLYAPNLVSVATDWLESATDLKMVFLPIAKIFLSGFEAVAARKLAENAEELDRLECEAERLSSELRLLEGVNQDFAEARSLEALSSTAMDS